MTKNYLKDFVKAFKRLPTEVEIGKMMASTVVPNPNIKGHFSAPKDSGKLGGSKRQRIFVSPKGKEINQLVKKNLSPQEIAMRMGMKESVVKGIIHQYRLPRAYSEIRGTVT